MPIGYLAMEWTIPVQSLDIKKVCISNISKGNKPMATLSYLDEDINFPYLSVLLPTLHVKAYEAETGRLSVSLNGNTGLISKLTALQTHILQTTYENFSEWFPTERKRSYEEIVNYFQPLISHGCIHLYCPVSMPGIFNDIHVYSKGEWTKGVISSDTFSVGKPIRIAVRFQGISLHQHLILKKLTGKSRVQHRILAIYTD